MRWFASTILAVGMIAGASTTPVLAAAAPGPAAKSAMGDTNQVQKVHRRWHGGGGFGGFGIYLGPRWGGYYGGPYYGYSGGYDPYYDDDYYYAPRRYYYPRYRYRYGNYYGGRRHHHHHRRYRR